MRQENKTDFFSLLNYKTDGMLRKIIISFSFLIKDKVVFWGQNICLKYI